MKNKEAVSLYKQKTGKEGRQMLTVAVFSLILTFEKN
jgi:hypothetical protein